MSCQDLPSRCWCSKSRTCLLVQLSVALRRPDDEAGVPDSGPVYRLPGAQDCGSSGQAPVACQAVDARVGLPSSVTAAKSPCLPEVSVVFGHHATEHPVVASRVGLPPLATAQIAGFRLVDPCGELEWLAHNDGLLRLEVCQHMQARWMIPMLESHILQLFKARMADFRLPHMLWARQSDPCWNPTPSDCTCLVSRDCCSPGHGTSL